MSPTFLIKGDLCVELKVTVLRTAANAHLTWLHVPHVKHNHHLQAGWVSSPSVPSAQCQCTVSADIPRGRELGTTWFAE